MKKVFLTFLTCAALICILSSSAFAQGRGRGMGLGRKSAVFVNGHDARDGRWDGRGPTRTVGVRRNGVFVARGNRVAYRHRYNMGDYWNRRHVMNRTMYLNNRGRYRNGSGRYR
jgi:hypothetical protein